MSLPEKILVRPAMKLWLFVKKHPWLSLLVLGLVWLLPPLIVLWLEAIDKLIALLERSFNFGGKVGTALRKIRDYFTNADGPNPGKRFWLLILIVSIVAPPLGIFLAIWHGADALKAPKGVTDLSLSAPAPATPLPEVSDPDLDAVTPDYGFNE